jgi:hypothetical protein
MSPVCLIQCKMDPTVAGEVKKHFKEVPGDLGKGGGAKKSLWESDREICNSLHC